MPWRLDAGRGERCAEEVVEESKPGVCWGGGEAWEIIPIPPTER